MKSTKYVVNIYKKEYDFKRGYVDYSHKKIGTNTIYEIDKIMTHHKDEHIMINGERYEVEAIIDDVSQNCKVVFLQNDQIEIDATSLEEAYRKKVSKLSDDYNELEKKYNQLAKKKRFWIF